MCNQNCNQGRRCTCGPGGHVTKTKGGQGDVVAVVAIIAVAVVYLAAVLSVVFFGG